MKGLKHAKVLIYDDFSSYFDEAERYFDLMDKQFDNRGIRIGTYCADCFYGNGRTDGYTELLRNDNQSPLSLPAAIYAYAGIWSGYDFFIYKSRFNDIINAENFSLEEYNKSYIQWLSMVLFMSEIIIACWLVYRNKCGASKYLFPSHNAMNSYNIFMLNDYSDGFGQSSMKKIQEIFTNTTINYHLFDMITDVRIHHERNFPPINYSLNY